MKWPLKDNQFNFGRRLRIRPTRMADAQRLVGQAHRLRSAQLQACVTALPSTRVIVATAFELSGDMHERIFALLEANMRGMYEVSGAWDAPFKRMELQHPKSRYLLALHGGDAHHRRSRRIHGDTREPILQGFVMWRYDTDETTLDDPFSQGTVVPVAYWYVIYMLTFSYELQVADAWQGRGIGAHLLQMLECLAWHARMRKTMLTVFRVNQRARSFYASHGYVTDATSPSNDDDERQHYVILCKPHPDLADKCVDLRQRTENSEA